MENKELKQLQELDAIATLTAQMEVASKALDFEKAAKLRDVIATLTNDELTNELNAAPGLDNTDIVNEALTIANDGSMKDISEPPVESELAAPEAKAIDNFDKFLEEMKRQNDTTPLNKREINRNEDGKFAANLFDKQEESALFFEKANETEYTFKSLFPNRSVDWEVVRNHLFCPEDIFERIMGIAMLVLLIAVFEPVTFFAFAFAYGPPYGLVLGAIALFAIGCFLFCALFVRATFPFVAMGIVIMPKIATVEGRPDFFVAAAMLTTVYLMFRVRKRKEEALNAEIQLALADVLARESIKPVDTTDPAPNQEERHLDNQNS